MAQPSVLVTEDSATVRRMIGDTLIARGHKVSLADNMDDALDSFAEMQADVVITDIFMPRIGGLEGIKIYREHWPNCRIIAMSAGFDEKMSSSLTLQAAVKSGVDGVLKKPFTRDDLTRLVGNLC